MEFILNQKNIFMKRFLTIALIASFFTASANSDHPKHFRNTTISKCPYGHCAALIENGNRCDKCAVTNNPYCTFHGKPQPHKKYNTKK